MIDLICKYSPGLRLAMNLMRDVFDIVNQIKREVGIAILIDG